jgi:ABC-type transport system involved in cytochrome c biogenesis permease component
MSPAIDSQSAPKSSFLEEKILQQFTNAVGVINWLWFMVSIVILFSAIAVIKNGEYESFPELIAPTSLLLVFIIASFFLLKRHFKQMLRKGLRIATVEGRLSELERIPQSVQI